jgi:hypothetical protein
MRPVANIQLHPARLAQLKLIAASYSSGIAETVERLIFEKMKAGVIPFETPGFNFQNDGDGVLLTVNDLAPIRLGFGHVQKIGEHIFKVSTSDEPFKGLILTADEGWSWVIGRVGRGYVHIIKDANGREAKLTATEAMLREIDMQLSIAYHGIPAVEYCASMDAANGQTTRAEAA